MRPPPTAFPHPDIPDEPREPLITAALSAFTRDDPRYRRLTDHDANGLFHGGPEGERDALVQLVGYQHCARDTATPDGERRQQVRTRGNFMARARQWQRDGEDPTDPYAAKYRAALESVDAPRRPATLSGFGLYGRPRKPANSGRKRKVA